MNILMKIYITFIFVLMCITSTAQVEIKYHKDDFKNPKYVGGWCDKNGFLVVLMRGRMGNESGYKYLFIHPEKGIISEYEIQNPQIHHRSYFTSRNNEFIVYYKTLKGLKTLTFYKDGETPIMEEATHLEEFLGDYPTSYILDDRFFFARENKKEGSITFYELNGKQFITRQKFNNDNDVFNDLKKEYFRYIDPNQNSILGVTSSVKQYVYPDSIVIVSHEEKKESSSYYNVFSALKFDFTTSTISNRELLKLEFNKTKSSVFSDHVSSLIIGDKFIIIQSGAKVESSNSYPYSVFSIYDLGTKSLLKKYRLDNSTGIEFKTSSIQSTSGKNLEQEGSNLNKALSLMNNLSYFDVHRINDNYVFKFAQEIYTSYPNGPTVLTSIISFYGCLDKNFDICADVNRKPLYQLAEEKHGTLKYKEEIWPNYVKNNTLIYLIAPDKKTDETTIYAFTD